MKSFKSFLNEVLTHRPQISDRQIFTPAAGYDHNPPEVYKPEDSLMVHMTSHFPIGGVIETLGSNTLHGRETLHFTRNGPVSDHYAGNWSRSKFGVMIPEDKISHRLFNHGSHDSFSIGNTHIPSGSRIIVNWDNLESHEKDHISALVGSSSHDEAFSKLNNGHSVNFEGRKVSLHATQAKENTKDAVIRHLRDSNINPVQIGNNYATGFLDVGNENEFHDVYGPSGHIEKYYERFSRRNNFGRGLAQKFASPSAGDHSSSPFSTIEATIAHHQLSHPESANIPEFRQDNRMSESELSKLNQRGIEHISTLERLIKSPDEFHPTAYSSEESQNALRRMLTKLKNAHSGLSPLQSGKTSADGIKDRTARLIKATRIIKGNKS